MKINLTKLLDIDGRVIRLNELPTGISLGHDDTKSTSACLNAYYFVLDEDAEGLKEERCEKR